MSRHEIDNMTYKFLLYELERRRILLEKNREAIEKRQLEEELAGKRKVNHNRK